MQTDAKVVSLTKGTTQQSPTSSAGRLPVALIQVRDKAAVQLKQTLQMLFDNADDTLFEMADRATSNAEQNAFFEAMRDLRPLIRATRYPRPVVGGPEATLLWVRRHLPNQAREILARAKSLVEACGEGS